MSYLLVVLLHLHNTVTVEGFEAKELCDKAGEKIAKTIHKSYKYYCFEIKKKKGSTNE